MKLERTSVFRAHLPAARRAGLSLLLVALSGGCAPSLVSATRDNDLARLEQLLAKGADPNDGGGKTTPLAIAVELGRLDFVKALVEAGADVNRPARHEYTRHADDGVYTGVDHLPPLLVAVKHGRVEEARYLLEKGADPYATPVGSTSNILFFSVKNRSDDYPFDERRVLSVVLDHIRATQGDAKVIAFVNDADEKRDRVWSPLAMNSFFCDRHVVEQLLAYGADPNALSSAQPAERFAGELPRYETSERYRPLHFAARNGKTACFKALLRGGADPKLLTSAGQTVEQIAAMYEEERQARAELVAAQREAEREEEEERRRQGNAFVNAFNQTMGVGSSPGRIENPVEDDSFQRKMQELANTASGRASESARAGSSTGRIVTSSETPSPATAPPQEASATPTAPTAVYTPPPERPRNCRMVTDEGTAFSHVHKTQEEARRNVEEGARRHCVEHTLRNVECTEQRVKRFEAVNGSPKRLEDGVTWTCQGHYVCAKPKEICDSSPGGGGATRQ